MFPLTSLSFSARSPYSSSPTDDVTYSLTRDELALGLQYTDTVGIKPLRDWLYGLQDVNHGRKQGEGWSVVVGNGSQDLVYKAIDALVNDGDPVLIESPAYAYIPVPYLSRDLLLMFLHLRVLHLDFDHSSQTLRSTEIETDAEGISASSLRSKIENWPAEKPRPKVLYTVPYGCNPTGMTASLERRVEVLKLAREFNIIILEDDPYFYLYYGAAPRPPSYFSLEKTILPETGRVLRFDSFSKVLSAGMRLGFVSGPEVIMNVIEKHTESSDLQASSLAQVIAIKLLDSWGYGGFKLHTERTSEFYREKRDVFQVAMMKYLDGYAEWVKPEAGLFFWYANSFFWLWRHGGFVLLLSVLFLSYVHEQCALKGWVTANFLTSRRKTDRRNSLLNKAFKLNLSSGASSKEGSNDSESVIRTTAFKKGVLALPGKVFLPSGNPTPYVRAAFSLNTEEEVNEALKRLRAAIVEARGE
ncbi:hypothetical protein D9756_003589 [Leucocoprinus leucothites]|uniref:Aminotransferase class I/classII large domain-containing protein n=1 Tax=Leucocoprinus leucothites TaxID=201217 RepID=A0A8H5G7S9_9AGAR|nr:hypothetical protein D9756_003589 [Leucoagaricus leucothites]